MPDVRPLKGGSQMTVISAVITRYCTAHASDSLVTELQEDGSHKPIEWKQPKIVAVRPWRGAMAYWGLAKYNAYKWSTFDWLQEQANSAGQYSSAEEFAQRLTEQLNEAISKMRFARPVDAGIGIHLTAYEYIENYWIPELFLISNFTDTSYQSVRPAGGVQLSRETYHTVADAKPETEHREARYRLKVHEYLHRPGGMLIYNNGDPVMFNTAAYAIFGMFRALASREKLSSPDRVETYLAIARRPIEIVSKAQLDFCEKGARVVGGKPHDLAVTPMGTYTSTTGDC